MNLKAAFIILSVAAFAAITPAWGQGAGGGSGSTNPAMLLRRDDVRGDLQITDDQKSKLYDLEQGLRQRFTEAMRTAGEDAETRRKAFENIGKKIVEEVNQILTAGQRTRLREIAIQVNGFSAASQPDVQKDLGLTEAQKAKIADLMSRMQKATRDAWQKVQAGEIQYTDVQEVMKKNQKILNDEIGKILTQPQKDKFKTLAGKTFVPAPESGSGG